MIGITLIFAMALCGQAPVDKTVPVDDVLGKAKEQAVKYADGWIRDDLLTPSVAKFGVREVVPNIRWSLFDKLVEATKISDCKNFPPDAPTDMIVVVGYVDTQNGGGAMVRREWVVIYSQKLERLGSFTNAIGRYTQYGKWEKVLDSAKLGSRENIINRLNGFMTQELPNRIDPTNPPDWSEFTDPALAQKVYVELRKKLAKLPSGGSKKFERVRARQLASVKQDLCRKYKLTPEELEAIYVVGEAAGGTPAKATPAKATPAKATPNRSPNR